MSVRRSNVLAIVLKITKLLGAILDAVRRLHEVKGATTDGRDQSEPTWCTPTFSAGGLPLVTKFLGFTPIPKLYDALTGAFGNSQPGPYP